MAYITLDELENPSGVTFFTDIPNILKVEDVEGGTKATITFDFDGTFYETVTGNNQWNITVFGNTIQNVTTPADAVNRNFIISDDANSTAVSVARAFRNCPMVYSTFNVAHNGNQVILTAREIGSILSENFLTTNITDPNYMTYTATDGEAWSQLHNSLVTAELYDEDDNYITTLEKTFVDGSVAFNLSPALTTLADYNVSKPFSLRVASIYAGEYSRIGNISGNTISVGYLCNQGAKYIVNNSNGLYFAQNVQRGDSAMADEINTMPLYTYENTIPLSFYAGRLFGGMNITFTYLTSAGATISSYTQTWHNTNTSRPLKQFDVELEGSLMSSTYYVDVELGNTKVRYRVIKPLNASEGNTRVIWINEYGGRSFFDFTGSRSETRQIDNTTYSRNIFDFYTQEINEHELVYNKKVGYTVTVQSHLIPKDAKYIFNSLAQSPYAWTRVNGQDYAIIVKSVSVEETEQNDVYRATVSYEYSQVPSEVI